jgi:hypothetical protein
MADDPMTQRPDETNEQYWERVLRDPRLRATLRALDEQLRTAWERTEIAHKHREADEDTGDGTE